MTLVEKPRILLISDSDEDVGGVLAGAAESHDAVTVQDSMQALALFAREKFAGVYVAAKFFREVFELGRLLQNEQILEGMPDGVALLEGDNTILWGNGRICEWSGRDSVVGVNFFGALGNSGNPRPRFLPFPHRLGHRPEHQFDAAGRRQPLLPRARRPGAGDRRHRRAV